MHYLSIDIIKIWFRIVICPSVIFFPDIVATITLIHKQIIAMVGYYACGAFIFAWFRVCSGDLVMIHVNRLFTAQRTVKC